MKIYFFYSNYYKMTLFYSPLFKSLIIIDWRFFVCYVKHFFCLSQKLVELFLKVKWLLANPSFFIPFLINQSGSVLNYYSLKIYDLSIAVPVVNALTLLVTILTGSILMREKMSKSQFFGLGFISIGVALCSVSEIRDFWNTYF